MFFFLDTGFLSNNCRLEFFLTFNFRILVVILFFIPIITMIILYIRIFAIIKTHQIQRAIHRQQSCQISVRSRPHSIGALQNQSTSKQLPISKKNFTKAEILCHSSERIDASNETLQNEGTSNRCTQNHNIQLLHSKADELQKQTCYNSTMVTSNPEDRLTKTILCQEPIDVVQSSLKVQLERSRHSSSGSLQHCLRFICLTCCKFRSRHSVHRSLHSSSNSMTSFSCKTSVNVAPVTALENNGDQQNSINHPRSSLSSSIRARLGPTSNNPLLSNELTEANTGHTKALVTTLLILGTYLLCYMPAVIYFALTCVDSCPFPITNMDWRMRISIGKVEKLFDC